jgi:hypothetical protein
MVSLIIFLIPLSIAFVITHNWVKGIEDMHKRHPDYKGEDLFDEDVDKM